MNKKKICLLSDSASHYRRLIYQLMDSQLNCDFIFGKSSAVKTFNISCLNNAIEVEGRSIGNSSWYYLPGIIRKTKSYNIIIDDMGIICLSSWLLLIVARLRGQKVILWGHGWYGREGFIKKWLKRFYSGLSTGMLVYGNYAYNLMVKNGFDKQKLFVIHNSLDYDTQLSIRKSINDSTIYSDHFENKNPVLIMIGRINYRKHLDILVEALVALRNKGKMVNAVLVGEGEEKNRIHSLVLLNGLQNQVWFYGACYDEAKNAELIYNADMCVVPGDIGLTSIHAMTFGCPCISHDYFPNQGPEFEAIIPGITGEFYTYGDAGSLADTIEKWFNNHLSDREIVRQACYKEIDDNWNPHRQIVIIIKTIERLCH